jgi:hypothetical protein
MPNHRTLAFVVTSLFCLFFEELYFLMGVIAKGLGFGELAVAQFYGSVALGFK